MTKSFFPLSIAERAKFGRKRGSPAQVDVEEFAIGDNTDNNEAEGKGEEEEEEEKDEDMEDSEEEHEMEAKKMTKRPSCSGTKRGSGHPPKIRQQRKRPSVAQRKISEPLSVAQDEARERKLLDLSRDAWWVIHCSEKNNPDEKHHRGATYLATRWMHSSGWGLRKTSKLLKAYRQFLELIASVQDWRQVHIVPSILVRRIWQLHIMDNRYYRKDCILLYGKEPFQDLDAELDRKSWEARYRTTLVALAARYGVDEIDTTIWSPLTMQQSNQGRQNCSFQASTTETNERVRSPPPPPERIQRNDSDVEVFGERSKLMLRIVEQGSDEEIPFRIWDTTPLGQVFDTFSTMVDGQSPRELRFYVDGKIVGVQETGRSLHLHDDCLILAKVAAR